MVDPNTHINEQWTVTQLIEKFAGHDFLPFDPEKDHFLCDFCSKGVAYRSNPRVGHYLADMVLNTNHPKWRNATDPHDDRRPLVPLASYCEECTTRLLLFPCEGFAEVRMLFTLGEERTITNPEVTDVSGRDDGIPWDPKKLSEKITGIPWAQNELLAALAGEDQLWGAENVVTFFLSIGGGVDIRELVQWAALSIHRCSDALARNTSSSSKRCGSTTIIGPRSADTFAERMDRETLSPRQSAASNGEFRSG